MSAFIPKEITEFTLNRSGDYTGRTYDFEDWRDMNTFMNLIIFTLFMLVFPIFGCLAFLLGLVMESENAVTPLALGACVSGYFLYDLKHEWFLTFLLDLIYSKDKWFHIFEVINWASLGICSILLVLKLLSNNIK